jgi:hypothetical protein
MKNITAVVHMTNSFFREYLLGESLKNILIRLTFILSGTIIVWFCMVLIITLCMGYQRRKQMQHSLNSHHHLYDSMLNLTTNQCNDLHQSYRYSSLSPTIPSLRSDSVAKQKYLFGTKSIQQRYPEENKLLINPNKTQAAVEAMSRPPLLFKDKAIIKEDSLNNDESKIHHLNDTHPIKQKRRISTVLDNIQKVKCLLINK